MVPRRGSGPFGGRLGGALTGQRPAAAERPSPSPAQNLPDLLRRPPSNSFHFLSHGFPTLERETDGGGVFRAASGAIQVPVSLFIFGRVARPADSWRHRNCCFLGCPA